MTACTGMRVFLELVAEQTESTQDGWSGHINEGTETFAAVEIENFLKLIEERRIALTFADAFEHRRKHRRFHAAGGALAARLTSEKLRDPKSLCDHTCVFRKKTHDTAAQCRARVL